MLTHHGSVTKSFTWLHSVEHSHSFKITDIPSNSQLLSYLFKVQYQIGGPHSTIDSVLTWHPAAPGSILGIPEDFPLEISFDVAKIY